MTITDLVLILFIAALLAFAIYDQFIMPRRNGPTLLAIPLLRRGRIDSVIFVGLIVILIYNNVTNHGALITTWLLSALALMGFYIFWIRVPKIIFKQKGFFFANVWIEYSRIKATRSPSSLLFTFAILRRIAQNGNNVAVCDGPLRQCVCSRLGITHRDVPAVPATRVLRWRDYDVIRERRNY